MLGKNLYQGSRKKALFVCTGGILRSPSAAHFASDAKGWNTRSCGIIPEAIPPMHINLLEWADEIYCLEPCHAQFIRQEYGHDYEQKIRVLNIPDVYEYREPRLLAQLAERLSGARSHE